MNPFIQITLNMEYVTSNKGGHKLLLEGFAYVKQKTLKDGVMSYECELRRYKEACKARLKVQDWEVVDRLHEHTHAPSDARCQRLKVMANMKRRAEETEEAPQQILTTNVQNVVGEVATQQPTIHHIRRNIRRQRQKSGNPIPVPLTRADIDIPEEYRVTADGQDFLLYDSGANNERVLIFSTQNNLNTLRGCEHWFLDGTFKTAPTLFEQLYTIHGLTHGSTIPCVYALLPNKQQATYQSVFHQLLQINENLQPQSIMVDFEKAAINSLQETFPNTDLSGCFYHLSQNVYRKVQSIGLQQRYQEEEELAVMVRMIPALAFVPADDVVNAFEELSRVLPPEVEPLADYFEDNYIGRPQRRGRREPPYPIALWNMHDRVDEELPRTNNSVEGWHRSFQASVGCYHPNFWKFLNFLKNQQSFQQVRMAQLLAGHPPPPQRKRYADHHARLVRVVRDYRNQGIIDYLRCIAYNIRL